MLRNKIKDCCSKSLQLNKRCPARLQSSSSSSSGKKSGGFGKVAVIAVGSTFTAIAAGTALAKYDANIRKNIEDTIPFADQAFSTILGPSSSQATPLPKAPVKPVTTPVKKSEEPVSLLQKKLDRDAASAAKSDPVTRKSDAVLPFVPAPVLERPPETTSIKTTTAGREEEQEKKKTERQNTTDTKPQVNVKSDISPEFGKQESVKSDPLLANNSNHASSSRNDFDLNSLPDKVREKVKQEMTEQLKLQLSAYNDYLHDQLKLQQEELSRMHVIELEDKVLEEKMRYQRELAGSIVRLQEVEQVLQVREKLDREERELKQIWFLCQQLNECLKSNPSEGIQSEPTALFNEAVLPVLERIVKNEDTSPLVKLAVQSIQEKKDLTERGVYTEDALIQRFDKVNRICKRVSLIGDEGGSLWRFTLSYILPSLLFDRVWRIPEEELADIAVNPKALDTFSILARVQHYLKKRNLEMSLRYANQLKGEPRQAALDWIRDVRNHLEIRQASTLIQAEASAVSLKTFHP